MRCHDCEKIIGKNQKFYEVEGEVYCEDCVTESTVTYYTVAGGDVTYTDEEMAEYSGVEEYIKYLKDRLKWIESKKKELEEIKERDRWEELDLRQCNKDLKDIKEFLDNAQM